MALQPLIEQQQLDTRALRLLIELVASGSVTQTAEKLGLAQSTLSHQLEQLRRRLHDPLLVRAGRRLVPTERAEMLSRQAVPLLAQLLEFGQPEQAFEPKNFQHTWVIAANDLQRDLLLPPLLRALRSQAPGVKMVVRPADVPSLSLLRDEQVDLVISPRPPLGGDIKHRRLLTDSYRLFYDPDHGIPPTDLSTYQSAEHVSVVHHDQSQLDFDRHLRAQGIVRQVSVQVSSFSGVRSFIDGAAYVASLPGLLRCEQLRGLADVALPFPTPVMPLYAIWHLRHQHHMAHQWLRATLWECANRIAEHSNCPKPVKL